MNVVTYGVRGYGYGWDTLYGVCRYGWDGWKRLRNEDESIMGRRLAKSKI